MFQTQMKYSWKRKNNKSDLLNWLIAIYWSKYLCVIFYVHQYGGRILTLLWQFFSIVFTHLLKADLIFSELTQTKQNHTYKMQNSTNTPAKWNFALKTMISPLKTDSLHQNNTQLSYEYLYRASTKHCCDTFRTLPSKYCLCFGFMWPCYIFRHLILCRNYFLFLLF